MRFLFALDTFLFLTARMDTNFQTSFIPKKPLAEERAPASSGHTSLFTFIATIVFVASLAGGAAAYFYKASLRQTIVKQQSDLDLARNAFEPSLITQLKQLDRRITDANTILSTHIVVSPIFDALAANTLKSIQFTKFTYTTPTDSKSPIAVQMTGKAHDYSSIALESDQLATNKNIHNSIFSNLSLDDQTGNVTFDLSFTVDADLVRYTNHLADFTTTDGGASDTTASSATVAPVNVPVTPSSPTATGTSAH